ncbi:MAG: acyl-CoA dehydrogenase family protein [Pseudomonadota bacterium]
MDPQGLLDSISRPAAAVVYETDSFLSVLLEEAITASPDPLNRLVHSACRAGSHANAMVAGHQAAVRHLFPDTPLDAITAFCVSEKRGPHPKYIETRLEEADGRFTISGQKMWGTMAPPATLLYVAASRGVVGGQNQLVMVGVETTADGIKQIPLPPERQAGAVPICDLEFEQVPVAQERIYSKDAYTHYIKPFRLVEDVFSTLASQIVLYRLGGSTGMSPADREDLLGLIVQGYAIGQSDMESAGAVLLLTSYLRASQQHWNRLAARWADADVDLKPYWDPEREILTVAARARQQRRINAWSSLGEPLQMDAAEG